MAKKFGGLVHQWAVDQRLASPLKGGAATRPQPLTIPEDQAMVPGVPGAGSPTRLGSASLTLA